jgi:NDP-sugar pyrophosphorylase family protein
MQKRGGLPEPIIAYVMAWLAHQRKEDISWKHYLNRTVRKYFEKSYKFIAENSDAIK